MRVLFYGLLALLLLWATPVWAGSLSDRISAYPDWRHKPDTKSQFEEINYPDWIAGTWHCSSTLVEMIAPLAGKDITTPGFEGNRKYLNQPVLFDVKFGASTVKIRSPFGFPSLNLTQTPQEKVVLCDKAQGCQKVQRFRFMLPIDGCSCFYSNPDPAR